MLRKVYPIVAAAVFLAAVAVIIFLVTRPKLTPAEQLHQQPPRFTFLVQCKPVSVGFFVNPFSMVSDTGEPKPGKQPRKYTIACRIPEGTEVLPLYSLEKLEPSIPMPKAGEMHTFTLYEDAVIGMVNVPAAAVRLKYPLDSEGMWVYPVETWPWVSRYVLNLVCFEEISESTQQPEHACWLH